MKNLKNGSEIEIGLEVGKRKRNQKIRSKAWEGIIFGGLFAFWGIISLESEGPVFSKGTVVPVWWLGLFCVPFGLLLFLASLQALLRARKEAKENPQIKPAPHECEYTDEEVAEAERNMDALYLREHGELPDKVRSGDAKTP